ncbi:hypothetical protein QTQ03_28360 [Micromonospora sp. WMMA1363]|uniref:hypothetical protein n=1 Tax=Micromonospora sp. WMMA1363 TaxID=3053985 RepID=UPI00259D1BF4|nr:hypothetical protein [Micromonospora sp. WMMA1363]MDM4723321.1 hypothetical protein [Micromonospora sp. WMMA1363]
MRTVLRGWVALPVAVVVGALIAGVVVSVLPRGGPGVMPAASPSTSGSASPGGRSVAHPVPRSLEVGGVSSGYGATRVGEAGVPAGFARSPDGAVAAATAWLATVEGSATLDARRRGLILAAVGDPRFSAAAGTRLADRAAALGLPASGRPSAGYLSATVWADRGAYRVASYDGGSARVDVWHLYQLGVVPPGGRPGPGRWRRAAVSLRWDDSVRDWRLTADFAFADGPDPRVAAPSRLERTALLSRLGEGWRLYANTGE